MQHSFLEQQARIQYRLLSHDGYWTQCHAQEVNENRLVSRELVYGEEAFIKWARKWNTKANLFVSRNPRTKDGKVAGCTCVSFDIDPIREPKRAALSEQYERAISAGSRLLAYLGEGYLSTSGNGSLLLLPFEKMVDATEVLREQCKALEVELRTQISDQEVTLDATYDFARLVKVLGSISTKGDVQLWRHARFIEPANPLLCYRRPRILERIQSIKVQVPVISGVVGERDDRDSGGSDTNVVAGSSDVLGASDRDRFERAKTWVNNLDPRRADDYNYWLKCGIALHEFGDEGLRLWREWSKQSAKYRGGDCESKWRTFGNEQRLTVGTIKFWAEQDNPQLRAGALLRGLPEPGLGELAIQSAADIFGEQQGQRTEGISTGFGWLDEHFTGGYRSGNVYAIEAITSAGKTVFAVQSAYQFCGQNKRVLLVTTEMSTREIRDRFIAVATSVNCAAISSERLNGNRTTVEGFINRAKQYQLFIRESASPSIRELEQAVEQVKPDVLIFDYFQHVDTGITTRATELATLARGLEKLAKTKGIPILVTAQLHELYDFKTHKRLPSKKNDVKDCKAINDAASAVLVIDWLHSSVDDGAGAVSVRWALDKNRHGPRGETLVKLDRSVPRFEA